MNTTKQHTHTSGTWEFHGNNHLGIPNDDAGYIFRTQKFPNGEIGSTLIAHLSNSPGTEEADANGRLIAAAPDLLKNVRELAEALEHYAPDNAILARAKATLEKLY